MIKVLIVEDEWIVAHFIADVAISQGFEVVAVAQNYNEAKELITSKEIDCALVDINIKGSKHGLDVAILLKEKRINFLFLTAYKDLETMKEAILLKPLLYLIKPVSQEDIIAALFIVKNECESNGLPVFPFSVDSNERIFHNNIAVKLSTYERIVFIALIKHHRHVVTLNTLYALLWEDISDINEGTLRNIILKLRKNFSLQIDNIKDTGYCLVAVKSDTF
jgi:DNA-binding response OmpR family regulator